MTKGNLGAVLKNFTANSEKKNILLYNNLFCNQSKYSQYLYIIIQLLNVVKCIWKEKKYVYKQVMYGGIKK